MAKKYPREPLSPEQFEVVLDMLKSKALTLKIKALGVRSGENPNEVIFETREGDLSCEVSQSPTFICIKLPSGKIFGIPKEKFGLEFSETKKQPR